MEANTFNKKFTSPVLGLDDHRDTRLASELLATGLDFPFAAVLSHVAYMPEKPKLIFLPLLRKIQKQLLMSKLTQQVLPAFWLAFGLQHSLHKPARVYRKKLPNRRVQLEGAFRDQLIQLPHFYTLRSPQRDQKAHF